MQRETRLEDYTLGRNMRKAIRVSRRRSYHRRGTLGTGLLTDEGGKAPRCQQFQH